MREHMGLFRGKRSNGEWAEGSLHIEYGEMTKDGNRAIDYRILGMRGECYYVDPATIGECTSLKDKNGKLIFEGDIVKATIVYDMGCGEEMRTEQGVIGYDTIGMLGLISHFYEGVPVWTDFFHELSLSGLICDYYFEAIGNIHDNPELLKGGEQ